VILWWVGNALLAFVALPIALALALRIIGSLRAVTAAARGIAGSVESVSAAVPPVVATLSTVAGQCRRLESAVSQ
jgi:hypothetical protein